MCEINERLGEVVFNFYKYRFYPLRITDGYLDFYFEHNNIRIFYDDVLNGIKNKQSPSKVIISKSGNINIAYNIQFSGNILTIESLSGKFAFSYINVRKTILPFLRRCILGQGFIHSIIN